MESTGQSIGGSNVPSGTFPHWEDEVQGLSNDTRQSVTSAANGEHPVVDRLATGAHHAVDRIAGAVTSATETIEVKGRQFKAAQSHFTDRCSARVHEKPIAALGLATGMGFLMGWLLTRR